MIGRAFAYLIVILFITGILCAGACAQVLPGHVVNMSPDASQLGTGMAGGFQTSTHVTDVLLGKNTKGPYSLSWKPVDQSSEGIVVNSRRLERGVDYTIDYASGALGFMMPIDDKSIIRVEYTRDPEKAVPNNASLVVPLTYDLMKRQNSSLQFTGLFKQGDPNAAKSDLTVLGLTGATRSEAGEVSSMLLFTPVRDDPASEDASFLDKAALKLGASTKTDDFEMRASLTRIGEHFAGAKEYKLKQGSALMDLMAAYKVNEIVSLNSTFVRTENLMGEKKGEATETTEHKIVVDPKDSTKLTLTRKEVGKEQLGSEVSTTTDKIELQGNLNEKVSAVATHENLVTDTGGTESRLTTNQLELNAKAAPNVAVKSIVTQRDSSETGGEVGLNLDVDAAATKTIAVKLGMSTLNTDATGRDDLQTLKVLANPSSKLSVELGLARRDSEAKGDEAGQTLKLSSAPISRVTVEMDYSNLDSEITGSEEKGSVRVVASPYDNLKISAALGHRETLQQRDVSKEARIEAKPFNHTTVGAAYKEVESRGGTVSKITEVTAATKPVTFAELTGGYKQRSTTNQEDLDTLNLALKLDVGGPFKLVGAYAYNPEEKGIVQRVNNQTVGLQTDMGRLKLKGGFTVKDEYTIAKRSEVTEVGMDYRLSSKSLLTTSYKLDEYEEQSVLDTSIYSLGFTHRMGSDFNLYLGGKLTTYERDRLYLEDQTEYEAEAKLGVRF